MFKNSEMKKIKISTSFRKMLADTTTPVSIYLRLRDMFPNSLLLESSDYHSRENNMSYVCCVPIAGIKLDKDQFEISYPDGEKVTKTSSSIEIRKEISDFCNSITADESDVKFISNGLFGYFTFDAVQHFEDIKLNTEASKARDIPFMQYNIYQYVIAIDHFRNELYIFEHTTDDKEPYGLDQIEYLIQNKDFPDYQFSLNGPESSNLEDKEFKDLVEMMKMHIYRGDVFQIVPSRAFSQPFLGDEFNVYRALRSINPSPYLFYFDYGNFKLFGSSPESQLTIKNDEAAIYPIAGTFKRSGNDEEDLAIADALKNDPKESAEHVMLVDLARNDLSKHCEDVKVQSFKESQLYSHVIHLVSKVTGTLRKDVNPFDIVADTFPAGTLSGSPKYMALTLIDRYETVQRSYYSGAIGFMGFNGDFNHAIMIRSFLSKQNTLHYQAGAGIVADSNAESELKEVDNKIAALRKALQFAETINKN